MDCHWSAIVVFSSKETVVTSVLQAQCERLLSQGVMLTLAKQKVALKLIINRKNAVREIVMR